MAIRYVRSNSSATPASGPGAYTDRGRAARSIGAALKVAVPGDTIRILDNAVYAEGELRIDKAITIDSAAALGPGPKPTEQGFTPATLPRIRPAGRRTRVLRIQARDKDGKQNAVGPVVLRGLTVENGQITNSKQEAAQGDGAGIVIVNEDNVLVENCCIRNNVAHSQQLGAYSTVKFKEAVANAAGRALAIVGMSAGGVMIRKQLDTVLPDERPNTTLFAQASGGGIGLLWSSGVVKGCLIDGNSTGSRGGGIAVLGYGWPRIEDCILSNNKSGVGEAGHRDGGGLAVEISVPEKLGRDLTERDLMERMTAFVDVMPGDAALAMLGIAVVRSIGKGFNDVVFYKFALEFLKTIKDASWQSESVDAAKKRLVAVNRCRFFKNESGDDGGGIYASVLSRVGIEGSSFEKNRALHGLGGGIRSSMGSDTSIHSCSFAQNSAEGTTAKGVTDPKKMSRSGGGAIACRNVTLDVSGGQTPTTIEGNWTAEFAGGGVLVENASEGSMAGVPHLWHAILKEVFRVERAPTMIGNGVTISGNTAGAKQPTSKRGKGGGLYLLRDSLPDSPELEVVVEQFGKQVRGNKSTAGAFISALTGTTITTSELDLVDIPAKVDDGDVQAKKKAGTTGGYRYSS